MRTENNLGKRLLLITLLLVFGLGCTAFIGAQNVKVGVVEFIEENDIGLENAGRIIAQWVVTEIAALDTFDVEERLLLHKVLEEQELMLSGIIDDSQVGEIGELF